MRPAPPPPPAPRIAFPVGGGGSIDLVSSGEEGDNEIWTMPPSQMAIQSGVSVLKQAALGPKGVQAVRRAGASMAMAEMEARQDNSAAAATEVAVPILQSTMKAMKTALGLPLGDGHLLGVALTANSGSRSRARRP